MKLVICSIYDTKAAAYNTPMFFQTPAQAIRSFGDAVNDPDRTSNFVRHPDDYVLFELGSFDPSTGELVAKKDGPHSLGVGVNFLRSDV